MNLRRLGVLLLSVILVLAFSACTPTDTTTADSSGAPSGTTTDGGTTSNDEMVSVSYFVEMKCPDVYTSHDEMLCYQVAEEATNIDIEWVHPPKGQATEQFNLLAASPDKPDIMEGNWRTFSGGPDTAIMTNVIQDISDGVEAYMPNFQTYLNTYPDFIPQILSDQGKYYCVPYIFTHADQSTWGSILERKPTNETFVGIWMRKDFLDELDMDAPVTVDDYIEVLTAFKDELEIPYPFSTYTNFLKDSQTFASAFDITSNLDFIDMDGEAVFAPIQPEFKEYLTVMHELYESGLLDPDFAAQDGTTNQAKITTGETGMWLGYYSSWGNNLWQQVHAEDPNTSFDIIGLSNPRAEESQQLKYIQASYPFKDQGAAITTSCENVEAALTYLDWFFTEEGDLVANWGVEGESFEWKDGWPALSEKVDNDPDGLGSAWAIRKYVIKNGAICMDYYNRLVLGKTSPTPAGLEGLARWNSEDNGTKVAAFPPVTATQEEGIQLSALKSEIDTYVSEAYVQFIMGERDLDEFDDYVNIVQSMGLDEYTQLQQAALDRYYAR